MTDGRYLAAHLDIDRGSTATQAATSRVGFSRVAALEAGYRLAKSLAFGTPAVAAATAALRARTVEQSYRRVRLRYDLLPPPVQTREALLVERGGERLQAFRRLRRRPRVLFVGTDYAQDSSGILAGLEAVGDVLRFTRSDGRYGQPLGPGLLSFRDAAPNGSRLLELLEREEGARRAVDVVIGQMWDGYIDRTALQIARERFGALVVNIGMDDRHTFDLRKLGRRIGTRGLAPVVDLAATAAPEVVDWFHKERCAAIYLPEGSDPTLFAPEEGVVKRYDVAFVGTRYGIRGRLVRRLEQAGIHVEARGSGWSAGRIPTADVPRLFAESRVVLGVGAIGHSTRLVALKLRDFDAPMSGSCYVTQRNPDLESLYDVGREIVTYDDEDDCVRVVAELISDDARREEIARRGRLRAARDHTWERRFQQLLDALRGSSEAAPSEPPAKAA